jgi:hypothetical protein
MTRSSDSPDRLALERDLPTSRADVTALRRAPAPVTLDVYLRFLAGLPAPTPAALRARRSPAGEPFALPFRME